MDNSQTSRSFGYAVFSFVTDTMRGTAVPVGVALWSPDPSYSRIRLIELGERTKGLPDRANPFIQMIREKVGYWMRTGALPYAKTEHSPSTSGWWRDAAGLLIHNVRISEPRPIECRNPDEEIELLFEAIVAPVKSRKDRMKRVDGVLKKALGPLATQLPGGPVPGYKGRDVWVHRHAESQHRLLIVEALNLAAINAELETDALVSRLLRVREADDDQTDRKQITVMVGYLSSPTGLNGEAALRDWIERKTDARTFDLIAQETEFRDAVDQDLQLVSR